MAGSRYNDAPPTLDWFVPPGVPASPYNAWPRPTLPPPLTTCPEESEASSAEDEGPSKNEQRQEDKKVIQNYYHSIDIRPAYEAAWRAASHFRVSDIMPLDPTEYLAEMREGNDGTPEFPGETQQLERAPAAYQAYEEHAAARYDTSRLVMWVHSWDNNKKQPIQGGIGVTWRLSLPEPGAMTEWQTMSYQVNTGEETWTRHQFAGMAVHKAIQKACEIVHENVEISNVTIYTSSVKPADMIREVPRTRLGDCLVDKAYDLVCQKWMENLAELDLFLRWCPVDCRMPGLVLAEKVAKKAARYRAIADEMED